MSYSSENIPKTRNLKHKIQKEREANVSVMGIIYMY